jgi:GH18 family chitinase
MKARFTFLLICLLTAYTARAQYTFPACYTAWAAGTYTQGNQVSHNSANWQAKYYTTAEPGTNGDWQLLGKCGDGGIGPNYTGPQRIVGYLPYWVPNFNYTAFDPGTCTQINIAFNLFKQNNNDFNSANFASVEWGTFHNRKVDSILFDLGVLNRAHAKGTKVSVAIGGATDYAFLWLMTKYYNNDAKLEEIANFITNYVNTKGIDGVDLDLECWWPDATISGTTEQGGRVRGDKWGGPDAGPNPAGTGLKNLAQKLRAKMPNKVLSAAVFGTSYYGNNYDDGVAQYLDFLGLMTYDFTGSWNTSPVGPHSSLYKVPLSTYQGQTADNPIYSAQDALEYWMGMAEPAWNHDGGFAVQKNKLCIGVPFYGYDLATRKPNNANGFVALKWNEIVAAYPNAATSYDPLDTRQLGGYIGADNKKIYYETPKGAGAKINYTKAYGHQGVIVWELTGDTPYGGGSSLLKALNDAVGIVVNPAPTTSITSPANNATFTAPATVTINANASDTSPGTVAKVEFYNGTTLLGSDTSSPYSFSWTNVAAGTYTLTTKATDNQGAVGTSSAITITVNGTNPAPTTSITSPANAATFTAPASITINANAADTAPGTVSKVDFYNGTTLLGTDTTSPYSFSWTNVAAGTYTLTTKATDNQGAVGTSAAISVTVNTASNPAPTTSITSPANNAAFSAPASITINANATDTAPGTVAKVDFYNGTTLLGTDTSSPYSFSWTSVAAGTYTLTTKATDDQGAVGTSAAVTVTVNVASNPAPTTSITSPANNATFTAPASITINANATDTSPGTVAKVDFYNGSTLLGTDTSSPYSFSWTSVAAGTYTLTTKATDNQGAVGTSAAITVTVSGGTGTCTGKPQYVENNGYVAGSQVQNVGSLYECKPYPYTGWCNGAAWAYAPGTGTYWTDAWILKGSCSGRSANTEMETPTFAEENGIVVSPNPGVSGRPHTLTIFFESDPGNVKVMLHNTNGTSVMMSSHENVKRTLKVEMPAMTNGLYILRVQSAKKTLTTKYMVD